MKTNHIADDARMSVDDRIFMDKVRSNMEAMLSEGEVDIDAFARLVGVSRSKFFYKMKALTGCTPREFFREYNLQRAARMILDGRYKVSAIAQMAGFSSPSHFSKVFRQRFGVLPSRYRDHMDRLQRQSRL